jgi:ABC-2 type transport system permease protein/oleandomycin transport system permease protein
VLFGYAFSWVFALLGLLVSSPEAANSLGFIAVFPLTFISSAFVPAESMPAVLEWFADVNPFTIVVDAMRALWLDAPAGNSVWGAVVWSLSSSRCSRRSPSSATGAPRRPDASA